MPAPHLAEFVSAYVLEAEEHLGAANTHLLATERALRAGESNLRGVREVFRALHTVKGLSAMVGVEPIVTLSHRMEALLRSADRSQARLPLGAVDVLLRGVQAIEQRVSAFRDGRPVEAAPLALLREIDSFDAAAPTAATGPLELDLPPELAAKLGAAELEQLQSGLSAGKHALCVSFEPSTEKAERGLTIKVVREALEKLGEIVKVVPVALQGSASGAGLAFAIILLTTHEREQVAAAVDDPLSVAEVAGPSSQLPVPPLEATLEREHDFETHQQGFVRVNVTRLDESVERLSALIVNRFRMNRAIAQLTLAGVDTRELLQIQNEGGRQLRDLRAAIFRVRMVPTADLLERIPLLVRGLRRAVDRAVNVQIDAGTTEVDKAVAERLFPALVHLVRNAVDHAIETPDERVRRGKPPEGLLKISCAARSDTWLELLVEDDGRGIDREAVARKARREVPTSEAALLELLCEPGLSTREVATTTSGRGMGMEIVKRTIEQLGGELFLRTQLGAGSTFILRVPLSLSIVDGFSFECREQRFVVPVASVDEIIEVDDAALVHSPASKRGGGRVAMLERRGEVVPLLSLAAVLGLSEAGADRKALIVRRGAEAVAFAVDRMLGQQEVVVRPLDDALVRVRGVAGATDLGDGKPTLVLDLAGLGAAVSRRELELRA
ncbi:MAG: Signal transduction histidine kinase CheA [Polyangiaceae bacterium]|nr:Signal transduction histidine kinase CheA [Polyangiaceae bacterium]